MSGKKKYGDVLPAWKKHRPGPHGKREMEACMQEMQTIGRTSPCVFPGKNRNCRQKRFQGSLTVETALLLPLFWYAISGFLYFFLLFRLQEDIGQTLADIGRDIGCSAYDSSWEEAGADMVFEAASLLHAKLQLKEQCQDLAALRFVEGGADGICLDGSFVMRKDARIELTASYRLRTPWVLLGIAAVPVTQKQVCRAWVGYAGESGETAAEELVYVTPYGEVFHRSMDCRYLDLSIQMVSRKEAEERRSKDGSCYWPCESCCVAETQGMVYITDYGNRYHQSLECGGLKRTIRLVSLSEVHGKHPCSGCSSGG